ncbi:hypothetical protein OAA50_02655 [Candidatus Pelagibacter sp.]|nr:hypothetical protein [Candidatus Pelagibacter sp.]
MTKKIKILATIQCRSNSSRFPNKILTKIVNKPIYEILALRLRKSKFLDKILVVTTTSKKDDLFVNQLIKKKIDHYRGSQHNVLKRLTIGASNFNPEIIVQLTGDNPFIDISMLDKMINYFLKNKKKIDFLTNNGFSNMNNRTSPLGTDIQIYRFKDLLKNFELTKNLKKKDLLEHPSLYFYREGSSFYKLHNLKLPKKWNRNYNPRLTIDTKNDLKFWRSFFKKLSSNKKNIYITLENILKHLDKNKDLLKINNSIHQKIPTLLNKS